MQILEIETEVADGLARIALKGELDLSTVNKVEDELKSLEASGADLIVLDLSRLSFLDSTGLRCLVTADQRPGAGWCWCAGPTRSSASSPSPVSRSASRWSMMLRP